MTRNAQAGHHREQLTAALRKKDGLVYAGIGSRTTPPQILPTLTRVAQRLADAFGATLRSGGAIGADTAFAQGAGSRIEIFYADHQAGVSDQPGCYAIEDERLDVAVLAASVLHRRWGELRDHARRLHARNVFQVLGPDLNAPIDLLLCWATPRGTSVEGGTRTAFELARQIGVPCINFASNGEAEFFEGLLSRYGAH